MSPEGDQPPQAPPPDPAAAPEDVDQEELRRRLEEQLRSVRVQDLVVESAASIVNLTARRIAKPDERDLEQGRVGIDAVRALVGLIEGEVGEQIRTALSELQLLYAREAGAAGGGADAGSEGDSPAAQPPGTGAAQPPPGQPPASGGGRPAGEPPPRLWTPPGA